MKTYVVSLKRSTERRAHMQALLTHAGISFEFFDAIDGTEALHFLHCDKAAPELTFKRKGYHLIPAEIACYASHFALWEKCVELNEPIVILEDNVKLLTEDLHSLLKDLSHRVEQCGYIKMSAHQPNQYKAAFKIEGIYSLGFYCKGTCGTSAYIISPQAAKQFILHAQYFIEPVDDYMEKPWRHGVKAYHVFPSAFERSQTKTVIGTRRKQKQPVGPSHKLYIEGFRAYETLMRKLTKVI
ncbi:glycosyltransferase family 25 protein [Photobacterium sp. 53610]|uniref:glycosyltransferase family 25 protein n=1 Tax=Photobacterium sp. 53610 TaxID=3102789 RepID=UPI002ED9763A